MLQQKLARIDGQGYLIAAVMQGRTQKWTYQTLGKDTVSRMHE